MQEENVGRHHQVLAIKKQARSDNRGRSYRLPGLWACRLAAGLTQRQVAESIGSNQTTVRELEREYRGAYTKTIVKLSRALSVTPEDLLCGEGTNKEEARR
jgi:DNA-binding XRE family transcriptional regulator